MSTIHCSTMHDKDNSLSCKLTDPPRQDQSDRPVASRTRRLSSTGSRGLEADQDLGRADIRNRMSSDPSDLSAKAPAIKKIAEMYQKDPLDRNEQEVIMLETYAHLIPTAEAYLKSKQEKELLRRRLLEVEESNESIEAKTQILAKLIKESRYVVIYTGAGISTSASIPDYRGPNGLWTQIKRTGTFSITKVLDLSNAEPTYTHMAIKELCRRRVVKHVVSQNCDGLHLRSGIAQNNLSEIHGNMYIEVCPSCEKQYFREADVTQQTCRFKHKTGRKCHDCTGADNNLLDTIVLYGERSRTKWPMNWERAAKAAKNADLIICMGSSLKTLRRYACLWPSSKSETKLVIINLQHTPKDKNAFMKISGKCDFVMENVMRRLNITVPAYEWSSDPLMRLSVPFTQDELVCLKRNLIFDSKKYMKRASSTPRDPSLSPSSLKRQYGEENRSSPSLFVSELTDDPGRKRLRMRIRAVNVAPIHTPEESDKDPSGSGSFRREFVESNLKKEEIDAEDQPHKHPSVMEDYDSENLSAVQQHQVIRFVEYAPPGWLGKSLGYPRSNSYRRKRHGNKGRKRATVTVRSEPSDASAPVPGTVPQQA